MPDSMLSYENTRMLFIHAHPDDESIFTGGTISKYSQAGAEILIVCCTLGELGESLIDEHMDSTSFGLHRYEEALGAVQVYNEKTIRPVRLEFLGGRSYWHDSGMRWEDESCTHALPVDNMHERAFCQGSRNNSLWQEQIQQLSTIVETFRPHHVVTYDKNGTYGHPDHVHAHNLTMEVLERHSRWKVSYVSEITIEKELLVAAMNNIDISKLPHTWIVRNYADIPPENKENELHIMRVNVSSVLETKKAAMRAHRSQLAVHDTENAFVLTNRITSPISEYESYRIRGEWSHQERDFPHV